MQKILQPSLEDQLTAALEQVRKLQQHLNKIQAQRAKAENQDRWKVNILCNNSLSESDKVLVVGLRTFVETKSLMTLPDGFYYVNYTTFGAMFGVSDDTVGKFVKKAKLAQIIETIIKRNPKTKKPMVYIKLLALFYKPAEFFFENLKHGGNVKRGWFCRECKSVHYTRKTVTIYTCCECGHVSEPVEKVKEYDLNKPEIVDPEWDEENGPIPILDYETLKAEHEHLLSSDPEYQAQQARIEADKVVREREEEESEEAFLDLYRKPVKGDEDELPEFEEDIPVWETYEVEEKLEPMTMPTTATAPAPIRQGVSRNWPFPVKDWPQE